MKNNAFLGIDLGGTGVKAGVFDVTGRMLGFSRKRWSPLKKGGGLFEVPAEKILMAAKKTVSESVAKSKAEISAISIASQGQTFVSLDKKDRPVHNAILWYDSRGRKQAEELREKIPDPDKTGITPICAASKILWLRENSPEAGKNAAKHLLLPDLLNYTLTGNAATDPATAASTGLYSDSEPGYNRAALEAAGIPGARLSEIIQTGKTAGKITRAAAKEWGLKHGTPVISGTNDQYAGALGAGNCRPGIITETIGTCMAVVTLAEKLPAPLPQGLLAGKFPLKGYCYLLAYSKTAGILLDWFVKEFCGGKGFRKLESSAAKIPPGANGVSVLPDFDGSVFPASSPCIKGAFINMTLNTSKEDIFRAILESLGYSLEEKIALLEKTGIKLDSIRAIGGGAKSGLWMQIQADIMNAPLERPLITEAAALGAAMIAAAGAGLFPTLAEASRKLYRPGITFYPDAKAHTTYAGLIQNYRRLNQKAPPITDKGAPHARKT